VISARCLHQDIKETVDASPIGVERATSARTRFVCRTDLAAASDREMRRHDIATESLDGPGVPHDWRDRFDKRIQANQHGGQRSGRQMNSSGARRVASTQFGPSLHADRPHVHGLG